MAYGIRGITITSDYYGQFAILYPYIDEQITPVPVGSYSDTGTLSLAYPWFPIEATFFCYVAYSEDLGFVYNVPFTIGTFRDRFYSYTYSDIWTFSNGAQYRAYGSANNVDRGITLASMTDSALTARFIFPVNANYVQSNTVTSYNPEYDANYGYYVNISVRNNVISFTNSGYGFSEYPSKFLLTDYEKDFFQNLPIDIGPGPGPTPGEDPYSPGGETEEGGGTGTFDNTSEAIPIPDLPTTSAVETGFISLYKPSLTQLKALATYLWSANGLDLDTFKRIFSDPISAILGLSLVPIDPGLGNDVNVVLGNIATGVTMPRVPQQYQKFNCGSLQIQEYWGGYLDYAPYTRAEIYLPFIGVKPLNIDDIMGKTVSLWYVVDFLSGGCVACLECGGSVLYQFIGQCACSIPITGNDMTNVINGILSVVGAGVGTMVATGGMGLAGLAVTGALASNVMGMKSHVEKSGSMGGMGGMLGVKTPYIILTRPRQALPATQNKFTGYPSFITTTLGSCEGYTVVSEVHLENISATEDEKREIEQLLKGGVIL